ncbi:MAG: hypothetical protein COB02_07570 [Candidatus Cloacimonadota bacterium]|nr:MAG: hypothetical protein COB02_07570 [Candidatus Cloacimonadota bacterium]
MTQHIFILLLTLITLSSTETSQLVPSKILKKAHKAILSKIIPFQNGALISGERGHLFTLDTSTLKMTQIQMPINQFITSIVSNGKDKVWCVGHDGLIIFSKDSTKSFQVQNIDIKRESPLFDIVMDKNGQGLAVGAYGYALFTKNFGKTWTTIVIDEYEPHLYNVVQDSQKNYYICGELGSIYKLDSNAKFIKKYETGLETSFFGLEIIKENSFFAYGLRGLLLFTKDGLKFEKVPHQSQASFYGSIKKGKEILFYGTDGTILSYDHHKMNQIKFDARTKIKTALIVKHKVIQYLDIKERIGITGALIKDKKIILTTTHGLRDLTY